MKQRVSQYSNFYIRQQGLCPSGSFRSHFRNPEKSFSVFFSFQSHILLVRIILRILYLLLQQWMGFFPHYMFLTVDASESYWFLYTYCTQPLWIIFSWFSWPLYLISFFIIILFGLWFIALVRTSRTMLMGIQGLLMCSQNKQKIFWHVTVKYNGYWFKAEDLIK